MKTTLGLAYKEFGYNEHPAITSRFLCIEIIDCNVRKFRQNEHPLIKSSFCRIFLLVVSGTLPVYTGNVTMDVSGLSPGK